MEADEWLWPPREPKAQRRTRQETRLQLDFRAQVKNFWLSEATLSGRKRDEERHNGRAALLQHLISASFSIFFFFLTLDKQPITNR